MQHSPNPFAAREILQDARVTDAHSDLPYELLYRKRLGEKDILLRRCLPGMRRGRVSTVIAAIYLEDLLVPELATRTALEAIGVLLEEIEHSDGAFRLCTSAAQMEMAHQQGAIALWLSLEGVEPVHRSLGLMRAFCALGVRLMSLTWARSNEAAYPASMRPGAFHKEGLTEFGRELVQFAWQEGMALDLSHLGEGCVKELIDMGFPRLYASHANARGLVGELERNLDDAAIAAIAGCGGVVGINSVRSQLAPRHAAEIASMADHMEYIRGLTGTASCLGIGLDLCDMLPEYVSRRSLGRAWGETTNVLSSYVQLEELTDILWMRGWEEGEIRGILGGNWERMLQAWLP